jgi:uncharacterized protein (DUF362 family)/NAD-dependent dihydropyrimidine dehydrogenase PreA subunit
MMMTGYWKALIFTGISRGRKPLNKKKLGGDSSPPFFLSMKVCIESIQTYDLAAVKAFISRSFEELHVWKRLEQAQTILLKPNLLGAHHPDKAITTHPVVVEAVIQLLQDAGKTIWLGDSPGGSTPVKAVWKATGIGQLAQRYGVEIVNFSEGGVKHVTTATNQFGISSYAFEADAMINLCKYKTHSLMLYTGAVKNFFGLIPGLKKSDFHRQKPKPEEFAHVISELYGAISHRVAINILDGIWGMEGEGPSAGEPRNFGVMMASCSAAALDSVAAPMMGFELNQLGYVQQALAADGILKTEVPEEWKGFTFKHVKIKKIGLYVKMLAYSPPFIKSIFQSLYDYWPAFNDECRRCGICVQSCPVEAMTLRDGMKQPQIDHTKCIKCMCCHEMCPYHAVYIKKTFLARFLVK